MTGAVMAITIFPIVGLAIVMQKEQRHLPAKDLLALVIKMVIAFVKNSSKGKSVVSIYQSYTLLPYSRHYKPRLLLKKDF